MATTVFKIKCLSSHSRQVSLTENIPIRLYKTNALQMAAGPQVYALFMVHRTVIPSWARLSEDIIPPMYWYV